MRPAKTTLVVFASSQLSTVVGFVATFYIASYLGPEVLGTYSIVIALLFWLHLPANAIDSALTKRISEGDERGEFLSAGLLINGAITTAVVIAIVFFSSYVNAYVGYPASDLLAVLVIGYFGANVIGAGLRGQQKVARMSLAWTTGRVIRTVLQIGLTYIVALGVAGLLWGHAISLIVAGVVAIQMYVIRPARPSMDHVRRLFEYARYSWLGTLKSRAFTWMDTVVMAFFVSTTLIGIYEIAWTIASTLAIVSVAINETLFPKLSELDADKEHGEVRHLLNEGLVFAGMFVIPGLFGALTFGEQILEIYDPAYGQGATVLVFLVLARLTNAYSGQFMNTINAIDRPDAAFRINAVFVAANLVLNLALIPVFGWIGAATATALSSVIALGLSYYVVDDILNGIDVPFVEIGAEVAASLAMSAVVLWLRGSVPTNRFTTVGIVFFAAIIYTSTLLALSRRIRTKMNTLLPQLRQFT